MAGLHTNTTERVVAQEYSQETGRAWGRPAVTLKAM